MKNTLSLLLGLLVFLTACNANEKVPVQSPKQEAQEKPALELQLAEVQEIVKSNINGIYDAFDRLGDEQNWNTANAADFSIIRPEVLPFATEEFADTDLKTLSEEYYCECDSFLKPTISYDVRFTFELKNEELSVNAIQPATEIERMGSAWNFIFIKEDGSWKLSQWNTHSLEGEDLQLTQDEVALLFPEANKVNFLKEYDSAEAGGKAYLFSVAGEHNGHEYENESARSSKDTSYVYDYQTESEEPQQPETTSSETQTQVTEGPEGSLGEVPDVKLTAYTKPELLTQLDQLATQEIHREYQSDYQMMEDYGYNYQLWDQALNHIYTEIKGKSTKSEFVKIRDEQRQWIADRDAAAQKRYDKEGGGSLSRVVKIETLFTLTKERCYELVNAYM
jgi:uncharacterized protein YecT (DUF1311 family)